MVDEVSGALEPARGGLFVDCTVGLGGHARALLEAGASRLIGLDRDPAALALARETLARVAATASSWCTPTTASSPRCSTRAGSSGWTACSRISASRRCSSTRQGRGFSFRRDEPLDMRMDTSSGTTAADLLAAVDEKDAGRRDLPVRRGAPRAPDGTGDRRRRASARPIETTGRLADDRAAGHVRGEGYPRIDPATRTFQAIRIWVNRELDGLDAFLGARPAGSTGGGRLVVITFHSLEDRIVKHTLRGAAAVGRRPIVQVLTQAAR